MKLQLTNAAMWSNLEYLQMLCGSGNERAYSAGVVVLALATSNQAFSRSVGRRLRQGAASH